MNSAPWTLCVSACTDARHPLGLANRAMLDRVAIACARRPASIAHLAIQRIESSEHGADLSVSTTFDGASMATRPHARTVGATQTDASCVDHDVTGTRNRVDSVDAWGGLLATFVRSARLRAPGHRLVYWVVGHGHELGARVQQHSAERGRSTARRPFASIELGSGLAIEGASLGRALAATSIDVLFLQSCAQSAVETLASLFENGAARTVIGSATQVPPPCASLAQWVDGVSSESSESDVFAAIAAAMRGALVETSSGAQGWAAPRGFELALASHERWSLLTTALQRVCGALLTSLNARERDELSRWIESGASRASQRGERVTLDSLCEQLRCSRPRLADELSAAIEAVFVERARGGDRLVARSASLVATSAIDRTSSEDFCERVGWFNAIAGLSVQHGVNA